MSVTRWENGAMLVLPLISISLATESDLSPICRWPVEGDEKVVRLAESGFERRCGGSRVRVLRTKQGVGIAFSFSPAGLASIDNGCARRVDADFRCHGARPGALGSTRGLYTLRAVPAEVLIFRRPWTSNA